MEGSLTYSTALKISCSLREREAISLHVTPIIWCSLKRGFLTLCWPSRLLSETERPYERVFRIPMKRRRLIWGMLQVSRSRHFWKTNQVAHGTGTVAILFHHGITDRRNIPLPQYMSDQSSTWCNVTKNCLLVVYPSTSLYCSLQDKNARLFAMVFHTILRHEPALATRDMARTENFLV